MIDRTTGEVAFPHTDVGGPRLIPSNNLSDLASKKAGLDNINIHGADVTSAATVDLDAATGVLVDITGATTITAITLAEGRERVVRFTGALTLTHGAALVLPGGANITTAPGDFATLRGYAAGVVRVTQYAAAWRTPFPSAAEEIGELIQALTEDTAPVPSTDMLGAYDASADTGKKITSSESRPWPMRVAGSSHRPISRRGGVNPGPTTPVTLAANTLYAMPFFVPARRTMDRAFDRCHAPLARSQCAPRNFDSAATTAIAGGTLMLGRRHGRHGTTGIKEIGSLSLALEIGYYCLVVVSDGAPDNYEHPARGGSHIQRRILARSPPAQQTSG